MKANLIRLLSGTFIYGGGAVLSRMITFLLLPLTTSYLTPEDYGIIGTLAIASQILTGLFTLGFGVALTRCYWATDDDIERHGLIWTSFIVLVTNIVVWIGLGGLTSEKISSLLLGSQHYSYHVFLTLAALGLNATTLPFATYLRIKERAFLVVSIAILEVTLTISTMIFLVMFLNRHSQGMLEAALIGQIFSFLFLLAISAMEVRFKIKWDSILEMLKIGYPYIFGLFGYFLMQCSSRYILQIYSNLEEVGLFFMGMNFGRTIELVVGGFISAWPPFFTSFVNKQEEASKLFGKVLTYYVIGMSSLLAFFFTLAKPIVLLMVQPPYYEVWNVIGILATSFALWGVYSISATGFIFYKKSLWQVFTEIVAGLSSIALSFFLIPIFQKLGAAIATLLPFFILISISFYLNRRLFRVEYEIKRIVKVASGLFIIALITFVPIEAGPTYNLLMASCLLFFFTYLWFLCLTANEKNQIRQLLPSLGERKTAASSLN